MRYLIACFFLISLPSLAAQEVIGPVNDRCSALGGLIAQAPSQSAGRLFIRTDKGWEQITPKLFGADFVMQDYTGGKLRFIYVAPPSTYRGRQFLSIRTIADTDRPDNFVNLRRHHTQFDTVYYGTYQDYHLEGKAEATLRRFHRWSDGQRSDEPAQSRSVWAFSGRNAEARRRVLAIGYTASDLPVCVPFVLGPHIATPAIEEDGEDELLVQKGFTVEVTEAKNGAGGSGRTFTVKSPISSRH